MEKIQDHRRLIARRLIRALIVVIAAPVVYHFLTYVRWLRWHPVFSALPYFAPLYLPMAVGPLVFLYVQTRLDPCFTWSRRRSVHFYPIIVDVLPPVLGLFLLVSSFWGFSPALAARLGGFIEWSGKYQPILHYLSVAAYGCATLFILLRRRLEPPL